jgi:RNA polymerase sigma-70 factor (family 1)
MYEHIDFEGFSDGDEQAFTALFHALYLPLCYFAFTIVGCAHTAEEVAIDAFVALWKERRKIKDSNHAKHFLFRVSKNACLNTLRNARSVQQRKQGFLQRTMNVPSHEHYLLDQETALQLRNALSKLPPQCSAICIRFFLHEQSYREIALEMGLAISTVRNQVARGVKMIREMRKW